MVASCAGSSLQGLVPLPALPLQSSMHSWVQGREYPFPSLNKWYFGHGPMQVCLCPRVTEALDLATSRGREDDPSLQPHSSLTKW